MQFLLTVLGFILLIPIVIVAAVLLLGTGAGLITRFFTLEMAGIVVVILIFVLIKKIFK